MNSNMYNYLSEYEISENEISLKIASRLKGLCKKSGRYSKVDIVLDSSGDILFIFLDKPDDFTYRFDFHRERYQPMMTEMPVDLIKNLFKAREILFRKF